MSMNTPMTRRAAITALGGLAATLHAPSSWATENLPRIKVSKDPSCGCCSAWIDHVRAAGFSADVVDLSDMNPLKARLGVPRALTSCHTAEVAGYVIEGHVPAEAIQRLLLEKPQARGLAVPGMPVGSPGMEVPGTTPDTYDVILFGPSGQTTFARYTGGRRAV